MTRPIFAMLIGALMLLLMLMALFSLYQNPMFEIYLSDWVFC